MTDLLLSVAKPHFLWSHWEQRGTLIMDAMHKKINKEKKNLAWPTAGVSAGLLS